MRLPEKNNINYSKFDMSESMCYQGHKTKWPKSLILLLFLQFEKGRQIQKISCLPHVNRNFKKNCGECYNHKWNFKLKTWTLTCTQKREYFDSVLKLLVFFFFTFFQILGPIDVWQLFRLQYHCPVEYVDCHDVNLLYRYFFEIGRWMEIRTEYVFFFTKTIQYLF